MSMKNSNNTIGNRTRDLPARSAVPQPTAPPRVPNDNKVSNEKALCLADIYRYFSTHNATDWTTSVFKTTNFGLERIRNWNPSSKNKSRPSKWENMNWPAQTKWFFFSHGTTSLYNLPFPRPCSTHVLAHSTNTLPASSKQDKNTGMLRNLRLCWRRGRGKQTIQNCPTNILPEDRICCAMNQLLSRIRRNKTAIYRRGSYDTCP